MQTLTFHTDPHALPPVLKVVAVSPAAAVPEGLTAIRYGAVEKSPL